MKPPTVKRPALRYHGGKWMLAPWIISHFPTHRIYNEPFGGAASVLLQKPRVYSEIYNDMDSDVVNLFRTYRDFGKDLVEKLHNTPYSREEFELSYEFTDDPIERARRMVVRAFQGYGSGAASGQLTGFRSNSKSSGTSPEKDWRNLPAAMSAIIDRFRGVCIENRPGLQAIFQYDSVRTLHYLDPPYVLSTRYLKEKTQCYRFEMSDDEHVELCDSLKRVSGFVVLSGYDNEIYNGILKGWTKLSKETFTAHGNKKLRVETLWINKPQLQQKLNFSTRQTDAYEC